MTSPGPLMPLHIETLSPQIHGFVRAYVWQLHRGVEPRMEDDATQQAALYLARAIVRLATDRDQRNRLMGEFGEYLRGPGKVVPPSEQLQKLLAELHVGSQTAPAGSASEQPTEEAAPAQDAAPTDLEPSQKA